MMQMKCVFTPAPGDPVMALQPLRVRESCLFSYMIGSADLWFSAVNERTLYLRNEADGRPVLRGEICDLGPGCYADLSQVLLEYALSCEGCQDNPNAAELVECTFERLGKILAKRLFQDSPDLPLLDQVCGAFEFVLRSMNRQPEIEQSAHRIRFDFSCCPLLETAEKTGFSRAFVAARRGFVALCTGLLAGLAPGWALVSPTLDHLEDSWSEIVLHY
jgi:hypothetical protein